MASQQIEERVQAVQILLTSVLDYLPTPVTSTGLIARSSLPGPAPGKRVPCGHCRRTGMLVYRNRTQRTCLVCDGTGWRRRRGSRNPSHPEYEQPFDEYTGMPIEEEAQHPAAMSSSTRDLVLDQLDHASELREGRIDGERYGWERERASYDRQGSYRELRRVLALLHVEWPIGYEQIFRFYLRGLVFQPSLFDRQLCDIAEEWVAREMRWAIRIPPWLQERAGKDRQVSVADLAKEGLTPGAIARRLRIPKAKVKRMLTGASVRAELALPGESGKA